MATFMGVEARVLCIAPILLTLLLLLLSSFPTLSLSSPSSSSDSPSEGKASTVLAVVSSAVQTASDAFPPFHLIPPGGQQRPVTRLTVVTTQSGGPFHLTSLTLDLSHSSDHSDIASVGVYWTGSSFDFAGGAEFGRAKVSATSPTLTINGSVTLLTGPSYLWMTVNMTTSVGVGQIVSVDVLSFTVNAQSYTPSNHSASTEVEVASPTLFSQLTTSEVSIPSRNATSPDGGGNFVSFQQNAITTYGNYQYLVYWNLRYHVCLTRRSVTPASSSASKMVEFGEWSEIEFWDYTINAVRAADNHYDISVGICPNDGTIHLSFDMHVDPLRYRMSVKGLANNQSVAWSNTSFAPVRSHLVTGVNISQVTYPRFIIRPDGNLQFETRLGSSGAGDNYLWFYNSTTGLWTEIGKYGDGRSLRPTQNAYIFGMHYDRNERLHVSWCWRVTPDAETDHDLYYGYSDDRGYTWYNSAGQQIAEVNTKPMTLNTTGLKVWTIGENRGLINQESQVVDSKGRIHILSSYMLDSHPNSTNYWADRTPTITPGSGAMLHHLYQLPSGEWVIQLVGAATRNRAQIAIDGEDNLYIVAPQYRIFFAAAAQNWTTWTVVDHSHSADALNEGLIDRELLLRHNTLSFAFANPHNQVLVPTYQAAQTRRNVVQE